MAGRVTDADMWYKERRPEIINLFKDNIYGRVPEDKLPKMIWEVRQTNRTETHNYQDHHWLL